MNFSSSTKRLSAGIRHRIDRLRRSRLGRAVRMELLSGYARYFVYPLLGLFVVATAGLVVNTRYPEFSAFMRSGVVVDLDEGVVKKKTRTFQKRGLRKEVNRAIRLHRGLIKPAKIVRDLKKRQVLNPKLEADLKASGVPVNAALTMWGRGVDADDVIKNLRDHGVNIVKGFSVLQVFVAPPVNDFLVNSKRRTILDLEEDVGKSIIVRSEPSYPVDVVHYRFLTADGQEAKVVIPAGLGVKK